MEDCHVAQTFFNMQVPSPDDRAYLIQVVGMLSVKDLLKEVTREKEELMTKVTEFKLGRGGFFEHT